MRSGRIPSWLLTLGFGLLLSVVLTTGRSTRLPESDLALVAPAAGVAVWWALWARDRSLARARDRPGRLFDLFVFAVSVTTVYLRAGVDVVATVGVVLGFLVHGLLGAALLRRWVVEADGARWTGPLRLLAVSAATGAVGGLIATTVATVRLQADFAAIYRVVLVSNITGTFLVMSLVLLLTRKPVRTNGTSRRRVELVGVVAATATAYVVIFAVDDGKPITWLVLPVAVWAGLRLGVARTTVLTVAAAVATVVATDLGHGPFSSLASEPVRYVLVQAFVVVTVATATTLAALQEDRRAATAHLDRTRRALAELVDSALIGHAFVVWARDGDPMLRQPNPSLVSLLQLPDTAGTSPDGPWFDLLHPDDVPEVRRVLEGFQAGGARSWAGELRHRLRDGSTLWAQAHLAFVDPVRFAPVPGVDPDSDAPPTSVVVAQFLNITGRKDAEAQLTHRALHDALTGLPNRVLLQDRIGLALASSTRSGSPLALIFLDLDHFKHVNDSWGHHGGDAVLKVVAARLREVARPTDTVSRHGGDEFVVCCPDVTGTDEANAIAARLSAAVSRPIHRDGRTIVVSVSAGVTVSRPGDDTDTLLNQSDLAMYAAKRGGRGQVGQFVDELAAHARRHTRLVIELGDALDRGEFVLHYQPVVDVSTGRPVACEALVRWNHPKRGLLAPGEWLDVAEESDLIVQLGAWVLQQTCDDIAGLAREGLPLTVHINLSGRQLAKAGLVDRVMHSLATSGLEPRLVVLELTETHLLEIHDTLLLDLARLRDTGVRLAVDDFGTGFSSLTQLIRLPVDMVKIDRSFVMAADTDVRSQAVIRGVVGMAEALGLEVVAEGVETVAEADVVRSLGCTTAQGYLWSRPVPLPALREFLLRCPVAPSTPPAAAPAGTEPSPAAPRSTAPR